MGGLLGALTPLLLAVASAVVVDAASRRRGLLPPGFESEPGDPVVAAGALRRLAGAVVVALTLWLGVFAPLATLGDTANLDLDALRAPQLFVLHAVLVAAALAWWALGYAGSGSGPWTQLGLRAARPLRELGIGVAAGVAAWAAVILVMLGTGLLLWRFGAGDLLPQEAPPLVGWLAGLPLTLRLAVSASAGVAEEVFFRGFLQPRCGIGFSTALFVLAHLSYDQPFMLLGIALLSVTFAHLVRWRQNVWAAVAAHATFDAIQLTVMIPWALEHLPGGLPA